MTNPKLPAFIRRDVERAIEDALHPTGMSTHDGKARIGVDRLQYMLRLIDGQQDEPRAPHQLWNGEKEWQFHQQCMCARCLEMAMGAMQSENRGDKP